MDTRQQLATLLIIVYYLSCSSSTPLMIIRNAIFTPSMITDQLAQYNDIISYTSCVCRCYDESQCITMNYNDRNQTCALFSASITQGILTAPVINDNSTFVMSFPDRNDPGITTTTTTASTTTTSSTTTSTVSSDRCSAGNSTIFSFTVTPTSYQQRTYNYTATSNRHVTLEFAFQAKNPSKTWHLDDVSIQNINASNAEMLINGNFENGTLIGWRTSCSSANCRNGSGGFISQTSCRSGSFCYTGACQENYDFLRQNFFVQAGHVYMLRFWLFTDGHSDQKALISITEE